MALSFPKKLNALILISTLWFDFSDDENNRPLQGKKYLNDRQVNAVVDFLIAELQGKPITKAYCEKYFGGPTKECELVEGKKKDNDQVDGVVFER